jgi:hypothetical protein
MVTSALRQATSGAQRSADASRLIVEPRDGLNESGYPQLSVGEPVEKFLDAYSVFVRRLQIGVK